MRAKHEAEKRSNPISVRLPHDLLANVQRLATNQARNMSNVIEIALRQWVDREGKRK